MFEKGRSGNPNGRPKKGRSLTDILEKYGTARDVETPDGLITKREALAQKVWELAIKTGDMTAVKYIYDRIDGTPTQSHQVEAIIENRSDYSKLSIDERRTLRDLMMKAEAHDAEAEGD
jgi:DNA helicase IV